MNPRHLLSFVPLLLPAFAAAQVQIPVNPRATYLRTENDPSAVPAPAIPLSALGVSAGQWLSITTVGAYADGGGSDTNRHLVCLFSSNPTLLPNAPSELSELVASGGSKAATAVVPAGQKAEVAHASTVAFVSGFNEIILIAAILSLVGSACGFLLVRSRNFVQQTSAEAQPAGEAGEPVTA